MSFMVCVFYDFPLINKVFISIHEYAIEVLSYNPPLVENNCKLVSLMI